MIILRIVLLLLLLPSIAIAAPYLTLPFYDSFEDYTADSEVGSVSCVGWDEGGPDARCTETYRAESHENLVPRYGDQYLEMRCDFDTSEQAPSGSAWSTQESMRSGNMTLEGFHEAPGCGQMYINDGSEYWIGFSTWIPSVYAGEYYHHSVIQMGNNGPAFYIQYGSSTYSTWKIRNEGDDGKHNYEFGSWVGDKGKWTDWVINVVWYTTDNAAAKMQVWQNGVSVVNRSGEMNIETAVGEPYFILNDYNWGYSDSTNISSTNNTIDQWDIDHFRATYLDEIRFDEQIAGSGDQEYCDVAPNIVPTTSVISSPTDEETGISTTPTITYSGYTDIRTDAQSCFSYEETEIQVDESGGDWSTLVYTSTSAAETSKGISDLSSSTAYQIRVRHYSGRSTTTDTYESAWSDTITFTTGGTYYVDDNGAASWANCEHDGGTPGVKSGAAACTLATANTNAVAGDIVNLRAGTYSTAIEPTNSGSSGAGDITYQAYLEETPTISGTASDAIKLVSKDYITIDGVTVTGIGSNRYLMNIDTSTYITIKNCNIHRSATGSSSPYRMITTWDSSYCTFTGNTYTAADDAVQWNLWGIRRSHHCVWDGESFTNTNTHDTIDARDGVTAGSFNIIRNCTFSEEYHRNIEIWSWYDTKQDQKYWLIENNKFENTNQGDSPYTLDDRMCSDKYAFQAVGIIRNNIYANTDNSIEMANLYDAISGVRIYNNTFYNNTYGGAGQTTGGMPLVGFADGSDYDVDDVIIKNNIIRDYQGTFVADGRTDFGIVMISTGNSGHEYINNSFSRSSSSTNKTYYRDSSGSLHNVTIAAADSYSEFNGNTDGTDPLMSDPASGIFALTSTSPAIDGGDWLTLVNETTSGSQTDITVDDASYFFDGWDISGETGDVIMTEAGQTATITSINYTTNVITVTPAISVVDNEGFTLDYVGDAPDIGAEEYTPSGADTTDPVTAIDTADPSNITSDSLTITGSASDAVGVNGCKWRVSVAPDATNGTSCTGTTSFSCSTSGYIDSGNYTMYVGCYDAAGNYGSDSITVNYTDVPEPPPAFSLGSIPLL